METNLFNSGIRPAINVGISVSRVGGSAQIKSMKKVSGTLKLDQAQFRELEAFSKFGSDLDAATKLVIDRGRRNQEVLKQPQYSPMPVELQVAILYASTRGFLDKVPEQIIVEFQAEFTSTMLGSNPKALADLKSGKLSDMATRAIEQVARDIASKIIV